MSEKKFPITYVTKEGQKLVARDDVQAAAFVKAGLKEEKSK